MNLNKIQKVLDSANKAKSNTSLLPIEDKYQDVSPSFSRLESDLARSQSDWDVEMDYVKSKSLFGNRTKVPVIRIWADDPREVDSLLRQVLSDRRYLYERDGIRDYFQYALQGNPRYSELFNQGDAALIFDFPQGGTKELTNRKQSQAKKNYRKRNSPLARGRRVVSNLLGNR